MQEQSPQILEVLERFREQTGLTLSRMEADLGILFHMTIPHRQLAEKVAQALTQAAGAGAPPCELQERAQQFGGEGFVYSLRTWPVQIAYNTVLTLLDRPDELKRFRQAFGPLIKTMQDMSYRLLEVASDVQNCQRMVSEQLQELAAA